MLRAFLELLPEGTRAAFEFRHPSWHDDDIYDALRAKNIALCVADSEKMSTPVVITADYGYFRLRDEGYQRPTSRSGQRRSANSKVSATCSSTSSTRSRGWDRTSPADSLKRAASSCQQSVLSSQFSAISSQ